MQGRMISTSRLKRLTSPSVIRNCRPFESPQSRKSREVRTAAVLAAVRTDILYNVTSRRCCSLHRAVTNYSGINDHIWCPCGTV
jgi:hypothetical protein